MTKKIFTAILLTTICLLVLSSCDNIPFLNKKEEIVEEVEIDPNFPVEVGGVTIDSKPERVVVLSEALFEQIYDMKLAETVVGTSDFAKEPYEGAGLPSCGTVLLPNIEQIEILKTDVVVTSVEMTADNLARLSENGTKVIVIEPPNDLQGLLDNYKSLAKIILGAEEGEAVGNDFSSSISAFVQDLKTAIGSQEEKNILYLRQLDFGMATGDSFEGKLFANLGLKNFAEAHTDWLYPVEVAESDEGKAELKQVDTILIGYPDITVEMLEKNEYYKSLPAVVEDNIIFVNYEAMERQSLRMFEQLLYITKQLYPEAELPMWEFPNTLLIPSEPLSEEAEQEEQ